MHDLSLSRSGGKSDGAPSAAGSGLSCGVLRILPAGSASETFCAFSGFRAGPKMTSPLAGCFWTKVSVVAKSRFVCRPRLRHAGKAEERDGTCDQLRIWCASGLGDQYRTSSCGCQRRRVLGMLHWSARLPLFVETAWRSLASSAALRGLTRTLSKRSEHCLCHRVGEHRVNSECEHI